MMRIFTTAAVSESPPAFTLLSLIPLALCWTAWLSPGICQEKGKEEAVKKEPPSPFLFEARFSSATESTPDNFTARAGKWNVDGSKKAIRIAAEPVLDGRVEFGPEIREAGATVIATAEWEKSDAPIMSWMGVGLHGKNGFSLRVAAGAKKIELVRRGETLIHKKFAPDPAKPQRLELSVQEDDGSWNVSGRIWEMGETRPDKPQLTYKAYTDELLFPLAGRPSLLATPFGGNTVYFSEAKVLKGEFEVWMDNWKNGNPKDKAKEEKKVEKEKPDVE